MEKFNFLSGNSAENEKKVKALQGELYSFNEESLRRELKAQGASEAEVQKAIAAEREKIRTANEKAKILTAEEEQERALELLAKELEESLNNREDKAA